MLVVEVSDPAMPVYRFAMHNERAASDGVSRMEALINGWLVAPSMPC